MAIHVVLELINASSRNNGNHLTLVLLLAFMPPLRLRCLCIYLPVMLRYQLSGQEELVDLNKTEFFAGSIRVGLVRVYEIVAFICERIEYFLALLSRTSPTPIFSEGHSS
jgi:hypothetical protein